MVGVLCAVNSCGWMVWGLRFGVDMPQDGAWGPWLGVRGGVARWYWFVVCGRYNASTGLVIAPLTCKV